jgi:hypothetical protein
MRGISLGLMALAGLAAATSSAAHSFGESVTRISKTAMTMRQIQRRDGSVRWVDHSGKSVGNKVAAGRGMAAHRAAMKKRRQNNHRAAVKRAGGKK